MSDSDEDMDLVKEIKISLVGETGTGKSMLCARYLGRAECSPTQGADVLVGHCPLLHGELGRSFGGTRGPQLRLCDVSGRGRDAIMLNNYLYGSNVIILVYDITNLRSFEMLTKWLERIIDVASSDKYRPLLALFGNKSDLEHQRAVRLSHVQKFATENKILNYNGSARTGDGVFGAFMSVIAHVMGIPLSQTINNNRYSRLEYERKPSNGTIASNGRSRSEENINEVPLVLERKKMREIKRKAISAACSLQ